MAEHDVKIKISEDGAGKAAGSIDGIGKAFQRMLMPIRAVRTAIGGLLAAMGTIGFVIHGWNMWIDTVKSFKAWLDRAKTAAFELMKAGQNASFAEAVEKAAYRAKSLQENLAKSLGQLKEMQQFGSAWNAGQRGVEGAALNLEEQRALAGVSDPDRRAEISGRFAVRRAEAEWKSAYTNAGTERESIDKQIAAARQSIDSERKFQTTTGKDLDEQRTWLRDARLTKEELDARYKMYQALEREITSSKRREEANEKLILSLERQKALLEAPVEQARLGYESTVQSERNAKQERDRKAVEEFVALSEKSARKYDRERANEQIDEKEKELSKAEDALKAEPARALANDRITAMGGFATAGAAAISGIAAGPDRTYQELRAQKDLLKQEIEQLKKIVKNTEDGGATFQ